MSYRTRIHSITGYSPIFLMFGRDLLTFTNWSEETDIDEVLAIAQMR